MKLAEPLFLSFQGEGMHTGLPSIFVRFFGCNKCCKWCDSLYAVNNPESIIDITTDELVKKIRDLTKNNNVNNIVFTGGEPGLFETQIAEIQDKLGDSWTYEIETNGSIPLKNNYQQINISPKLSNSGNAPYSVTALDTKIWRRTEGSGVCFKFVAKGKEDFGDILECVSLYNIPQSFVYIMPEGVSNESQNNKEVMEFCIKHGFKYCLRQHILLFGNKKGV